MAVKKWHTQKEFSEIMSVTPQTVQNWLKRETIPAEFLKTEKKKGKRPRVLIDAEGAKPLLKINQQIYNPQAFIDQGSEEEKQLINKQPEFEPVEEAPKTIKVDQGEILDFNVARTKKESMGANLLELELLEKQGTLIPVQQVEKEAFGMFRTVRDNLLNIPARISPMLCTETNEFNIHEIIRKEILEVLEDLSKTN